MPTPDVDDSRTAGAPVVVRGLVRGAELGGSARLFADPDRLVLEREEPGRAAGRLRLPIRELDGVRWRDPVLLLFLRGGDVLEVEGNAALGALEATLIESASALGELTRSLHALGSARAPGGRSHDVYYHPLLEARRQASAARAAGDRLAAFDPATMRARYRAVLRQLAAERWPDAPSERRALEAEIEEHFAPALAALLRLAVAAAEVRDAEDDVRLQAWRAWSARVSELFAVADRCWEIIGRVVERPAPARTPWWHVLGRRDVG